MKASDAVAKFLAVHQVHYCFELVGGMITHLLDSLAQDGRFNIISMHHEQAAAFAAEGVARQSIGKKLAVAMGTSGPVVASITKYSVQVNHASKLLPELHLALSTALSGRKGPVLIDIPNNVQRMDIPDADVEAWLNTPLTLEETPS